MLETWLQTTLISVQQWTLTQLMIWSPFKILPKKKWFEEDSGLGDTGVQLIKSLIQKFLIIVSVRNKAIRFQFQWDLHFLNKTPKLQNLVDKVMKIYCSDLNPIWLKISEQLPKQLSSGSWIYSHLQVTDCNYWET